MIHFIGFSLLKTNETMNKFVEKELMFFFVMKKATF